MKTTIEARTLEGGLIEPHHEIEVVCSACGYDLDEAELQAALEPTQNEVKALVG
jgi:hypothetical protein